MANRIGNAVQKKIVEVGFFRTGVAVLKKIVLLLVNTVVKIVKKVINLAAKIVRKILDLIFLLFSKAAGLVDRPFRAMYRKRMMKKIPVDPDKIVFLTFQGTYTCNAKWIARELAKRDAGLHMVWDVKSENIDAEYPLDMKFTTHRTLDFYKQIASAKVIMENTNIIEQLNVYKKPEQCLIQTWHGSLGIKRLDGAIVRGSHWNKVSREAQQKCDIVLTNSPWEEEVFRGAYWGEETDMRRLGHARNDVFFLEEEERKEMRRRICAMYGVDPEKKIFLFAPTHREGINDRKIELGDVDAILSALSERFGGEWVVFLRLHNRLKKKAAKWYRNSEVLKNVSGYPDMQEIMAVADAGVTDYSSWIFDYMESRKPGFIVEFDLADFQNDRGFYYPIETTPFPIVETLDQLPDAIRAFDGEKYAAGVDAFLKEKGCVDDGKSSERIADLILEIMGKENA